MKNRSFYRKYTIEIKGKTKNGFMSGLLDDMFGSFVEVLRNFKKQTKVLSFKVETENDKQPK